MAEDNILGMLILFSLNGTSDRNLKFQIRFFMIW